MPRAAAVSLCVGYREKSSRGSRATNWESTEKKALVPALSSEKYSRFE
jgi:hypothetical protein